MTRAIGYILLMLSCFAIGAVAALCYVEITITEAQKYVVVKDLDKAHVLLYNNNTGEIMYREEAILSFSLPSNRTRNGTYSCSGGELVAP